MNTLVNPHRMQYQADGKQCVHLVIHLCYLQNEIKGVLTKGETITRGNGNVSFFAGKRLQIV